MARKHASGPRSPRAALRAVALGLGLAAVALAAAWAAWSRPPRILPADPQTQALVAWVVERGGSLVSRWREQGLASRLPRPIGLPQHSPDISSSLERARWPAHAPAAAPAARSRAPWWGARAPPARAACLPAGT